MSLLLPSQQHLWRLRPQSAAQFPCSPLGEMSLLMAQDVTPWLLTSNYNPPSPPCLCASRGSSSLTHLYSNYPNYYCRDANVPASGPSAPSVPSLLCWLLCPQIQSQGHQSNLSCCLVCYFCASGGLTAASPTNLFAGCNSWELFSISKQSFPITLHVSMAFSPDPLPSREQSWFSTLGGPPGRDIGSRYWH